MDVFVAGLLVGFLIGLGAGWLMRRAGLTVKFCF